MSEEIDEIERLYREAMEPRFSVFREALFADSDIARAYPEPAFRERFIRDAFDARIGEEFREIADRPGDLIQNIVTEAYLQAAAPANENDPAAFVPMSPEEFRQLSDEIRADEHAARVRDYGEAEAATYDARVAEGAGTVRHLEPEPATVSPAELEAAVSALDQQWATQTYEVWHANDPFAAGLMGRVMDLPEPQFPADYTRVAEVQARDVDHVWQLTNEPYSEGIPSWHENPGVRMIANDARSSSVGDVFVDQAGVATRVEGFGFKEIGGVERTPDPLELARSRARESARETGKSKGPEIDI